MMLSLLCAGMFLGQVAPKNFAIIATIDQIDTGARAGGKPALTKAAQADAKMASALAKAFGFDSAGKGPLIGDALSLQSLRAYQDGVLNQVQPGSRVLFYYSGVGAIKTGGVPSLALKDSVRDESKDLVLANLADWVQNVEARGASCFVILDCSWGDPRNVGDRSLFEGNVANPAKKFLVRQNRKLDAKQPLVPLDAGTWLLAGDRSSLAYEVNIGDKYISAFTDSLSKVAADVQRGADISHGAAIEEILISQVQTRAQGIMPNQKPCRGTEVGQVPSAVAEAGYAGPFLGFNPQVKLTRTEPLRVLVSVDPDVSMSKESNGRCVEAVQDVARELGKYPEIIVTTNGVPEKIFLISEEEGQLKAHVFGDADERGVRVNEGVFEKVQAKSARDLLTQTYTDPATNQRQTLLDTLRFSALSKQLFFLPLSVKPDPKLIQSGSGGNFSWTPNQFKAGEAVPVTLTIKSPADVTALILERKSWVGVPYLALPFPVKDAKKQVFDPLLKSGVERRFQLSYEESIFRRELFRGLRSSTTRAILLSPQRPWPKAKSSLAEEVKFLKEALEDIQSGKLKYGFLESTYLVEFP